MTLEKINHGTTALVLIDLQNGIARQSVAPHDSREVLSNAAQLARAFRGAGAPVILVRVGYSAGGGEMLRTEVDQPRPASGPLPTDFSEIVQELEQVETDIVVTKHNWSAFYGTDLDVQLRRRGIKSIVLGGISTNMGVESTARSAHEHAYNLILVEDAMASMAGSDHLFAVERIFPRIGQVVSTQDVLSAMA
ncbi:MAG TPA: hydrolase [Candidatus Nanopelagicaceae bacterium]